MATNDSIDSANIPLPLSHGGTGTNLTPSNGGIFYSDATQGQILSATSTANQPLLSGASGMPGWSTATYPGSTTINQILYSSANNTVVGLASANSGVLVTSATGVPSISSTLPVGVAGINRSITQALHGFSVGNVLYFNGTSYVAAIATSEAAAEVIGVVASVTDANTFVLQFAGYITGLSGLTAGSVMFLSPSSAGALTVTKPVTPTQVIKPVLIADSTTTGYINNQLGVVI